MEQLSKHLGHSSVKVTEARYAHLTRDAKRKAAASIESERKPSANSPQPTPSDRKNTGKTGLRKLDSMRPQTIADEQATEAVRPPGTAVSQRTSGVFGRMKATLDSC
jgi:hypothetical protein